MKTLSKPIAGTGDTELKFRCQLLSNKSQNLKTVALETNFPLLTCL